MFAINFLSLQLLQTHAITFNVYLGDLVNQSSWAALIELLTEQVQTYNGESFVVLHQLR